MNTEWKYTPANATGKGYINSPVNEQGQLLTSNQPTPQLIEKAKTVLTELFQFLNAHNIEIAEDSEQDVVSIVLEEAKNGYWYVNYERKDEAAICRNGYLAGILTLEIVD